MSRAQLAKISTIVFHNFSQCQAKWFRFSHSLALQSTIDGHLTKSLKYINIVKHQQRSYWSKQSLRSCINPSQIQCKIWQGCSPHPTLKSFLSRSLHPCCKKTSNLLHKLPITHICILHEPLNIFHTTICIPWTIEYLSPCELHNWLSIRRDIKIVPVELVIICLQLGAFKVCLTLLAPMCTHSFPLDTFISILRGKLPKFLPCQNPAPE
jgi:hypothetical protein